ncbi:MAG TPA: MmcQ/YjbR family DNA-binding protein [Pilimelia sp.]|nr:MmcQ/YjbR family DNA-binding protein [Pilimelia sp.]
MAVTYAQAREWALALPGAEEVMVAEWGHPTLRVGGKMFASGGPDSPTMSVKASREEQAELIAADPQTFAVAPYVGRYGWVLVRLAQADPDELRGLLLDAWRRTAGKRAVRAYDADL